MSERTLNNPEQTKEAIRKHQETTEWEYREESAFWYGIAQEMDKRFFNGLVYPDGRKVPAPIIAFDDLRNKNTLAQYDLFPDQLGLIGKITFNTEWYEGEEKEWSRGRYSQGETLLHEYVHLWQQIGRGKDPFRQAKHGRNTHNKEFVTKAEELGIHPAPVTGVHTQIATVGSPIDILLKEKGIYPPKEAYEKPEDKMSWADWIILIGGKEVKKGRSTLHKYQCPSCGLKARIGINDDPLLIHEPCGTRLINADHGDIYKRK